MIKPTPFSWAYSILFTLIESFSAPLSGCIWDIWVTNLENLFVSILQIGHRKLQHGRQLAIIPIHALIKAWTTQITFLPCSENCTFPVIFMVFDDIRYLSISGVIKTISAQNQLSLLDSFWTSSALLKLTGCLSDLNSHHFFVKKSAAHQTEMSKVSPRNIGSQLTICTGPALWAKISAFQNSNQHSQQSEQSVQQPKIHAFHQVKKRSNSVKLPKNFTPILACYQLKSDHRIMGSGMLSLYIAVSGLSDTKNQPVYWGCHCATLAFHGA